MKCGLFVYVNMLLMFLIVLLLRKLDVIRLRYSSSVSFHCDVSTANRLQNVPPAFTHSLSSHYAKCILLRHLIVSGSAQRSSRFGGFGFLGDPALTLEPGVLLRSPLNHPHQRLCAATTYT
jgi:hypothetical protein